MSSSRRGIILAGGMGSRMFPVTLAVSKQLLPVYDKPLIYYSLSTLMMAGIRELLVITTPRDQAAYQELLGTGRQFGVTIEYVVQLQPEGLAQALILGRRFIGNRSIALVLGDNIFFGQGFQAVLDRTMARHEGATVFAYPVRDPERYGVVELDAERRPVSLEEKPSVPRSPFAVTGLYFYDNAALAFAQTLAPSARGELEITDLNREYLRRRTLHVELLSRGFAWLDTGTPDSLAQAANFVQTIEARQGLKVACPEEIAFRKGFISAELLLARADRHPNAYGDYLRSLVAADPTGMRAELPVDASNPQPVTGRIGQ